VSAGGAESQRFAAFLESVYQRTLAASPQLATEFGSKAGDDRWDDTSEAAFGRRSGAGSRRHPHGQDPVRLRPTRCGESIAVPRVPRRTATAA